MTEIYDVAEDIPPGAACAVRDDGRVGVSTGQTPILRVAEGFALKAGDKVVIGENGEAWPVHVDGDTVSRMARVDRLVVEGAVVVSPTAETLPAPVERAGFLDYPPGVHDMPAEHYYPRVLGVANKSALDKLHKSPATYRAWVDGGDEEDSAALAFGRAFHAAVLEPEKFAAEYTVEPEFGDCRKTENKAKRDAWRVENAGKVLVNSEDMEAILGMRDAVRAHPIAGPLLTGGRAEVTAVWQDPETKLTCKARADYLRSDLQTIVDLKTTQDARPGPFAKSCANYGYHRQAAFYTDGFCEAGEHVDTFVFVAVEKTAPYLVAVLELDEDGVMLGRSSIREDLDTMAACLDADQWPGYPAEVQTISLPPWAA